MACVMVIGYHVYIELWNGTLEQAYSKAMEMRVKRDQAGMVIALRSGTDGSFSK